MTATSPVETIFCISCDEPLNSVMESETSQALMTPSGGMYLKTPGNFGSTVFDPFDGGATMLECYLCDACAVRKQARIWHVTLKARAEDDAFERFDRWHERTRGKRLGE